MKKNTWENFMISVWFITINFLLALSLFFSGCGTVKSGVKKVSQVGQDTLSLAEYKILPKKYEPKKKVLVIPFQCAWNPSSKYGEKVSAAFAKKLKSMPGNILVYLPKNPSAWKVTRDMPRFGIINMPELVKDALELNMNYLITGIMDVMRAERRVNGVWPFRHYDQVFDAVMVVNVIDTVTGALVDSHMESEKFAIPLKSLPKDENKLFIKILKNTMPSLLRNEAKSVAKILEDDIWKGRILEVYKNRGKIKISAGKDVGIKKGMLLKVCAWGKKIHPPSAPPFYCLGRDIGKIKIVSVKDHYSIAVPLNKANYKPGLPVVFD